MKRRLLAALLCTVLATAAGCGDSDDGSTGGGDATTTSTGPGDPASGAAPGDPAGGGGTPGGSPSGSPSGPSPAGPGATGGTSGGSTTNTTTPLPVAVELTNACVRPGGTQTVVVRTTPGSAAAYDTTWSDGKNGLSGGYGGTGNANVDESGTWRSDFVVGPAAPAGKATVTALAGHPTGRTGRATADFSVAGVTGACT